MNVQNTKIRNAGKDNVDAFGDWLKARAIEAFDSVRKYFKQIRIQQERAKNNRTRSVEAHQQGILHNMPLEEKHRLGLYNLMD